MEKYEFVEKKVKVLKEWACDRCGADMMNSNHYDASFSYWMCDQHDDGGRGDERVHLDICLDCMKEMHEQIKEYAKIPRHLQPGKKITFQKKEFTIIKVERNELRPEFFDVYVKSSDYELSIRSDFLMAQAI